MKKLTKNPKRLFKNSSWSVVACVILVSLLFTSAALGQAVDDYRTKASGNWNANSTWERWNGTSWETPITPAYPTVSGTASSAKTVTTGTTHTVNLPSGIASGDLLLVFWADANDLSTEPTTPAGWTQLYTHTQTNRIRRTWYKVATGTEGTTLDITAGEECSAHTAYRIAAGTYQGVPVVGTVATGNNDNPNPPSLTPGFTHTTTLWIAASHSAGDDNAPTPSAPTNYTNLITGYSGNSTTTHARVATAYRMFSATTENPGTFTLGNNVEWAANTIAIQGSGELPPSSASNVITIRNGHTVTITDAASADQCIIEATGQVNVNSGQTWTIANGTGTDLTVNGYVNNSGVMTMTGNAQFNSGSTYQHSQNGGVIPAVTWDPNSTCLVTGMVATEPAGGDVQNFGHFTWNCTGQTGEWSISNTFAIQGNLTIQSTGTGTIKTANDKANTIGGNYNQSSGIVNFGNNNAHSLTVSGNFSLSGGSFNNTGDNSPGGTLNVAGDFSHTGTGILNGGNLLNVYLNGSSTQVFTSSGTVSGIVNFTFNNSAGITIGSDVTFNGTLTLTSGLVTLGSYNLTLGPSASIGGTPSASNMVVATGAGEFRKQFSGPGSFLFPVGDNNGTSEYSPITLNFTSGSFSSAYSAVKLKNNKHPNNSSVDPYINRYWTVTSSGISSFSCNVTCQYVDADIVGTEANLYCGKYDGFWTLLDPANVALNQLTGTVSSFSDFTGGEAGALPIELVSFSGNYRNGVVNLAWKTATEANNYGFDVERSADNSSWSGIGFVHGAGTVNAPRQYTFTDNLSASDQANSVLHYRLRQHDRDGSSKYSPVVTVRIGGELSFSLRQNYPNPFNPTTKISFSLKDAQPVTLVVYDALGKEVRRMYDSELLSAGDHVVSFDASGLPTGVYKYELVTASGSFIRTMTLVR